MKRILNIIKSLFKNKKETISYNTGALRDGPDYRDITVNYISGDANPTMMHIPVKSNGAEDIVDNLKVYDQGNVGSCVPHAMALALAVSIYKQTKDIVDLSPRGAYKMCKILDGHVGPGTYPRLCAKVFCTWGCNNENILNNVSSYKSNAEKEYLDFELTPQILEDAAKNKAIGFQFVSPDKHEIMRAIHKYGYVLASSFIGDWTVLPLKPGNESAHYTLWYKYEVTPTGDLMIHTRNSWGYNWLSWLPEWIKQIINRGSGYFYWNEYQPYVESLIVFDELPKELLNKIKNMPYRFTKQFGVGTNDIQVRELQKLLNEDPETVVALDGPGSPGKETTSFGPATKASLIKWQIKNNINPATGFFGPKSVLEANKRVADESKLRKWALAIQKHEGFFPGSRSYRNNNPGNIKYGGIYATLAIGKDSAGFCIFKSYEVGIQALETLLLRAAKGLSSIYKPDDTITQFFRKYAPFSDNNDPDQYAAVVANKIGVSADTPIKNLI